MSQLFDLLIVGAGPAGTAAAIQASRSGLSVVVIDKAEFPREKCCGDGLTAGALRNLESLGFRPESVPSWTVVDEVHIAGPDRRLRPFPLPKGQGQFAAVARRSELDAELVRLARCAGARVDERTEIKSISVGESVVDVATGGMEYSAKSVIAADGMWSPTRKLLGLGTDGYRGDWHGFRQYFSNVGPAAATQLCVWFEEDLLPGYVWSFPVAPNSANVGFGILRDSGPKIKDMKKLWPDILERPHIKEVMGPDATPEGPHRALPIPSRLPETILFHGRVIFVGDAARATDPMTGEGIGQALETGILAADCIIENGLDAPSKVSTAYVSALRGGMFKDHRLAGALSKALARDHLARLSLSVCDATPWTRRNFARWLFEDYPRAVLLTPRRWHRDTFQQSGSFLTGDLPD